MALDRDVVTEGLREELERFEELVRGIDADGWERPSRCAGWTVGDVARHAIGSMADVVAGRVDGLGTPEVTEREVAERQGRSPAELADECAEVRKAAAGMLPMFDDAAWNGPSPGGYEGTLADGVEALWYDLWLHGEDIRAALGRPAEGTGSGLAGGISHVAFELRKRGWQGAVPSTSDADAFAWVLSATGRAPLRDGLIDIYAA
jgi:uncharacterized protein (TIGR03083 family)